MAFVRTDDLPPPNRIRPTASSDLPEGKEK
jgi:hypothetical protein